MPVISIKMPFNIDDTYGISLIENVKDLCKQSLKNLVLTNPGEWLFHPSYGVGIESLLFSNASEMELAEKREAISTQARRYIPYITLTQVILQKNNEKLYISIQYIINTTNFKDILELEVGTNVG